MKVNCEEFQRLPYVLRLDFKYCLICNSYYDGVVCECVFVTHFRRIKETVKELEKKIGDFLSFREFGYVESPCRCDRKAHEIFIVKVGNVYGLYCRDCGAWIKRLSEREFNLFLDCGVEVI